MKGSLINVAIRYEHDVVLARQRARQIAALLGFDQHDQVRIATAVSEIVRNAFRYASGGRAEFSIKTSSPEMLEVRVSDAGPGIKDLKQVLSGRYRSETGMGLGIIGARRLMDVFEITSAPEGTVVVLGKKLPARTPRPNIPAIATQLAMQAPQDPFEEIQRQNQELLATIDEVQRQKSELAQLNKELEDTNRGVVALYAELDQRADYLRRASEQKTQFLSNMTHEFRTPLNSILSLSHLLLDRIDGDLTTEQERQVRFIQKSASGLSELVNDLLDLAKVEAGKVTIRPAEFQVGDLFGALRGMLRPLVASDSGVSLIFEDPPALPKLVSDESKISQILRNLISNALKFTESGEVRIRAAAPGHELVEFTVSDTGIGIAPEDQDRIFEEFTQVEGKHQVGKSGTGLGLPLSRKLAAVLGGTLTVQSEPGRGSTFRLTIPAHLDLGPGTGERVEFSPTEHVLLIDDDDAARYVLMTLLTGDSISVREARGGEEGLRLAREQRPAVIFLDLMMPGMDGFEVLDQLKADSATADIPVIAHSAKILTREDRERLRSRVAAMMPKSSGDRQLALSRLRQALAAARGINPNSPHPSTHVLST